MGQLTFMNLVLSIPLLWSECVAKSNAAPIFLIFSIGSDFFTPRAL